MFTILKVSENLYLYLLLVFGCIPFLSSCNEKPKEKASKPNIIFIFPDQLRSDYIGAKGGEFVHTPHIDRIAKEGVLFSRSYSTTPTCLPARAALLTGKKPWNHGLLMYAPIATKYENEMPQVLRDGGYYTFATGKLHFKPIGGFKLKIEPAELDNAKFMHGFHEIKLCEGWGHPKNAYNKWFFEIAPDKDIDGTRLGSTDHRSGAYIDFLEKYKGQDPYFLKVAFHRPHPPFDPPKRWLDFYKNKEIPKATVGEWSDRQFGAFTDIPDARKPRSNPRGNFGDSIVRESREGYLAAISFLDEQVGHIISSLEKRGDLENTLIVISSDHGDMMGDHHLWRKSYPYEGSVGVPMIIRWPESLGFRSERGQIRNEQSSIWNMDAVIGRRIVGPDLPMQLTNTFIITGQEKNNCFN
jgi:arylsulfatase A-like enzyme